MLEQLLVAPTPNDGQTLDEKQLAMLTAAPSFQKVRHAEAAVRPHEPREAMNRVSEEQALSQKRAAGSRAARERDDFAGAACRTKTAKRRSGRAAGGGGRLARAVRTACSFCQPLRVKARRLRERSFTVALFGAFSAGKSSLANALLGAPLLPSSPNPTTAAISKIAPPDEEHPHGMAVVNVKSERQMWDDVQTSLRQFGLKAATWEEALRLCARLAESGAMHPAQKPHLAFLAAVAAGYKRMGGQLGAALSVGFDELERYVADEAVSCFLDEVVLYVDCPLTRQGVTLVDTPGSIRSTPGIPEWRSII